MTEVASAMRALLVCFILFTIGNHAYPNLLVNSSFERGKDGWTTWGEGAEGVQFSLAQRGRTGKWAASILVAPDAAINWYQWQQTVTATPEKTYRLWGWVRTEGVKGGVGAYISLRANDLDGQRIAFSDSPKINGTRGWTLVWTELKVPAQTATVGVCLNLHGYGQALFDDLVLEEETEENLEQIQQRWLEMRKRGEWLLTLIWLPPDLTDAFRLPPDREWKGGRLFGWEQMPHAQARPDGLVLDVPLNAPNKSKIATLKMDVPAGRYRLYLWLGGDCGARIPLDVEANGQMLAQRVMPIRADVLSFTVEVKGEGLRISFRNSCQPLPFGPSASSPPIKAISLTRFEREPAGLMKVIKTCEALKEAAVSPVVTPMPVLQRPALMPVYAGEITPEDIGHLPSRKSLELCGVPGESVSGGVLIVAEPNAAFVAHLKGDSVVGWLDLMVGVPGWTRLAGMQRWDFWYSPARWFEKRSQGHCSPEGLGIVWLRARLPFDAQPERHLATLIVRVSGKSLSLPVHIRVLPPIDLPQPEADLGMFYNASLNLSCPDDELYRRWERHFADMREHGMNCIFVYTFRMLWHERVHQANPQQNAGWVWRDEALRKFLDIYSRYFSKPLYLCTHGDRYHPQGYVAYCRHVQKIATEQGVKVIFMPADEAYATEERLRIAEAEVKMVKEAGGLVAMTTDHTEAERLDPWLDIRVYGADFVNDEVIRHTELAGDVLAVYNGGSCGGPSPAVDRFFYGVFAWAIGAKGVFQWAYQWAEGDPLDDRDSATRDWCYTFPVGTDFCAPSPQWEAVQEGITDLRYLLAAERAVKMGIRNADALQALLNDVRRDVKDFLRANKYIRYLESVKNPPNPHPYETLVSQFPYSRLMGIRRKLQEALSEATTRDTNAERKASRKKQAK